jgi:hypothetical protein
VKNWKDVGFFLVLVVMVGAFGALVLVWGPAEKAEQKRVIQCETLGGVYHDKRCLETAGTIELPEGK